MYTIAIIGAGQIGSRHLQAISLIDRDVNIKVVDPSNEALNIASQRYKEMETNAHIHSMDFINSLEKLENELDVVIVATNADVRRKVIEKLLERVSVKYFILEKVLFQKIEDYQAINNLLKAKKCKAWVNFARRMWPFYQQLKRELIGEEIIEISIYGSNWGLGCNGIHFIDLLAFLTEETDIKIDTNKLENILIDSKRNGFKELKGTLKIHTGRGDTLVLNDRDEYDDNLKISILNGNIQYDIFESKGLVIKHISDNKPHEEKFSIPFQSEMTGQLVDQIFDTGESDLTPYDECMKYHIPMLDAFNNHISKVTGKTVTVCPIT